MTLPSTTTSLAPVPARRGPWVPVASLVLAIIGVCFSVPFGVLAMAFLAAAFVFAVISIRGRNRVWGLAVAALVVAVIGVVGLFAMPVLMYVILSAGFGPADDVWGGFWGFVWQLWLGPLGGFMS